MNIINEQVGAVAVVRLEGSLDTNTSPVLQQHLTDLLDGGATRVLIDCAHTDYMSSAGLRVLLAVVKRLTAAGGSLRLCALNETVAEVFDISGFSSIFRILPSEAEALEGF